MKNTFCRRFPYPPQKDQRGETLSTVILFPVVLILVLLILQMWFWASARTRIRIAADAAVRTAQETVIDADDPSSTRGGLDEAINSGLDWLTGDGAYVAESRGGYRICENPNSSDSVKFRSVIPRAGDCSESENQALVDVRIDAEDRLVRANVNGSVDSLLGNVGIPESDISARACGLTNPQAWAPNRAAIDLRNPNNLEEWGNALTC